MIKKSGPFKNKRYTKKAKPVVKARSVVTPKNVALSRVKQDIEAYKSNLSNLFSSNDATLTPDGFVRLFTDTGYYGDVIKALTIYQQDDLVGGLIDAFINVTNSKLNFDLGSNNYNETEIWNTFAKLLNLNTKNTLPGISNLNEQLMKSLVITGMAVPDLQWEEVKVGAKLYWLPTKINIYPSLGVKLRNSTTEFGEEEVLVGISSTYYEYTQSNAQADVYPQQLFIEWDDKGKKGMVRKDAYAIKYKYTPNNQTLYPTPMLRRSFESIALRHRLLDSDLSTLEMIINKIIQIKVGDKDNPPIASQYDEEGQLIREGDIESAQDLFETLEQETEVIATPYYYDISVIMPETNVLLDAGKYVQSTMNIMSNFGILLDPDPGSNSVQFEQINLKHYEKNAINLQTVLAGWYNWLAFQIVKKNDGRIKSTPSCTFDKPDIYSDNYLTQLTNLYTLGGPDIYTLLEKFGLDTDKIRERKTLQSKEEIKWEPRATFKQEVATPAGTKTTSTSNAGGTNNKNKLSMKDTTK